LQGDIRKRRRDTQKELTKLENTKDVKGLVDEQRKGNHGCLVVISTY
jgi:hypothetical protein